MLFRYRLGLALIAVLCASMYAQDKTTAALAANIPHAFQANTPYVAGALVTNAGSLYSRISAGTSASTFSADAANWILVNAFPSSNGTAATNPANANYNFASGSAGYTTSSGWTFTTGSASFTSSASPISVTSGTIPISSPASVHVAMKLTWSTFSSGGPGSYTAYFSDTTAFCNSSSGSPINLGLTPSSPTVFADNCVMTANDTVTATFVPPAGQFGTLTEFRLIYYVGNSPSGLLPALTMGASTVAAGNDTTSFIQTATPKPDFGSGNVFIGTQPAFDFGTQNAFIGYSTGGNFVNGSGNVFIGSSAGNAITYGTGNVAVGGDFPSNGNYMLSIQNAIYGVNNAGSGSMVSSGCLGMYQQTCTEKLELAGGFKPYHLVGGSGTPTVALGAGAGSGATYTLSTGSTDLSGELCVTTAGTPSASATLATLTYSGTYSKSKTNTPFVNLSASNSATSALATDIYYNRPSSSVTTLVVSIGGGALTTSTTYCLNYGVIQ